jgi:hypothetical protein
MMGRRGIVVLTMLAMAVGCDDGDGGGNQPVADMGAGGVGGGAGEGGMGGGGAGGEAGMGGGAGGEAGMGGGGAGGEGGEGGAGGEPQGAPFGAPCGLNDTDCPGASNGQCDDGEDNDGDGKADLDDEDCVDAEDTTEADTQACLAAQCASGDCTLSGFAGYGYCTRECEADFACENAVDGPYGTEFRCLTDGINGTCAPGSNRRCDGAGNGMCPEGEACKIQLVFGADTTYGATCQPVTEGGLPLGAPCDEDAGDRCANDMCLFGRCSAFCDPDAETNLCGADSNCIDNLPVSSDGSITIDICGPASCGQQSDCAEDSFCQISLDFSGAPFLIGLCLPPDEGQTAELGDACNADGSNCAGVCFGEGADSYCSAPCEVDADCPNGACQLVNFTISEDGDTAPANMCVPATGSGRVCEVDADCAAGGGNPQEACEYIVRQALENGRPQGEPVIAGRCAAIPRNAVAPGEACSDVAPCQTEQLCLRVGGSSTCGNACRNTADCGENSICAPIQFATGIFVGACIPAEGSRTSCERNGDCGEGEHCSLNVLPNSATVEQLCLVNVGMGGAGVECDDDRICQTGTCRARTTRVGDGYCEATCSDDADCAGAPEPMTCAQHLLFSIDPDSEEDDLLGGFCVPAAVCSLCDFEGTLPCGGGNVCSTVRYAGDRAGPACLPPCAGPGSECPAGHTCAARRNAAGAAVDGEFVCAPDAPDMTCLDARPRR